MKKTFIIAILAIALGGCGMFESTDEPVTAAPVTVAPAPLAIETLTPSPTTTVTTIETRYIDIGPVLDKLIEGGCVIDTLELRQVKRGGHASINCVKKVDALNAEIGDL
jgi:hypothetical protein